MNRFFFAFPIRLVIVFTLLVAPGVAPAFAQSPVTVALKFVPRLEAKEKIAPDPAKLSDRVRVEATADSAAGVARIVFEVNDQFRAEVKTPPYRFDWDTLEEGDGENTLSAIAYNNNGQTGTVRLKVTLENQLAKGIPYYAAQTLEAMRHGDDVLLEKSARRAFKINFRNPEAARAMAVLVGLQGDVNRGLGVLDDNQNSIPKDAPETLEVRGFLLRLRAFRNGNLQQMLPDLQLGMTLAREQSVRALTLLDKTVPPDKADAKDRIKRGDALFNGGKIEEALTEYTKAAALASGTEKRRATHRQVMALLKSGRVAEAEKLAAKTLSDEPTDAKARAVYAATLFAGLKYGRARDVIEAEVVAKKPLALIVACFADLAQGARREAYKEAQLAVEVADGAESQYAAMCVLSESNETEPAKKAYVQAALNAPLFMPVFVERAFQNLVHDTREDRFIEAITLFDVVLAAEPDNIAANGGRAFAMLCQKRYNGAKPYLTKFAKLDPVTPDVVVLLAADAAQKPENAKAVSDSLLRARSLEPINFRRVTLEPLSDFAVTMMRFRRTIPLTPSLLDR